MKPTSDFRTNSVLSKEAPTQEDDKDKKGVEFFSGLQDGEMTEEEAEALKKKKMYIGIGVAICVILIIIIAVVAGTAAGEKPFVRLCLPGYFHDGTKCRLNCDEGCAECDETTRACMKCSDHWMMTTNRTGEAQCVLQPCADTSLFNAGQGCLPCP